MSSVAGADYLFFVEAPPADLEARIDALMAAENVSVQRDLKPKPGQRRRGPLPQRSIDMRENIREISVIEGDLRFPARAGEQVLRVRLDTVDGRGCRPTELIELLDLEVPAVRVLRLETRFDPRALPLLAAAPSAAEA
jgi:hypothetical protein